MSVKRKDPVLEKVTKAIEILDDLSVKLDDLGDIGERNLEREIYLLYVKSLKVRKLLTDKERN